MDCCTLQALIKSNSFASRPFFHLSPIQCYMLHRLLPFVLISVLKAIDDNNPAVPNMLTDYILTGLLHFSEVRFSVLKLILY